MRGCISLLCSRLVVTVNRSGATETGLSKSPLTNAFHVTRLSGASSGGDYVRSVQRGKSSREPSRADGLQ